MSERLYVIASIYAQAEEVFGDQETATAWLNDSQFAFDGRAPLELLGTELGRQEVRGLLLRLEHGFVA